LAATLVVLAANFTTTNMALEAAFWSGTFAVNDFGSAIGACATLQGGIVWKRDAVDLRWLRETFGAAVRRDDCCVSATRWYGQRQAFVDSKKELV
jgi:hypothetical protein